MYPLASLVVEYALGKSRKLGKDTRSSEIVLKGPFTLKYKKITMIRVTNFAVVFLKWGSDNP